MVQQSTIYHFSVCNDGITTPTDNHKASLGEVWINERPRELPFLQEKVTLRVNKDMKKEVTITSYRNAQWRSIGFPMNLEQMENTVDERGYSLKEERSGGISTINLNVSDPSNAATQRTIHIHSMGSSVTGCQNVQVTVTNHDQGKKLLRSGCNRSAGTIRCTVDLHNLTS